MLDSLKLAFSEKGCRVLWNEQVEAEETVYQQVGVTLGTRHGSDAVYPNKGTSFFERAVRGGFSGTHALRHIAQFAALDTKGFINDTSPEETNLMISELSVSTVFASNGGVTAQVDLTLESGAKIVADLAGG
jgi:hypothetical protein